MEQYSNLRDPRRPRPRFRRIEVNMPRQPCHQQRWRASRRTAGNISSQDARNREPASRHHTKVGDLLLQSPVQAKPARVLPQYDERSYSTSLDSQPMHGGTDATGQSAMANDATAPTHRRRYPGESLRGGPTPPEPAIPPVAAGHEREPIRQGPAAIRVFQMEQAGEVDSLKAQPALATIADRGWDVLVTNFISGKGPGNSRDASHLTATGAKDKTHHVMNSVVEAPAGAPAEPGPCAIKARGLRVVRGGRVAVGGGSGAGVDLDVAAGSVTGLLGPSGCGKSTLMRSIVGVQRIDGGDVQVLGLPAGSAALRRRVGYVTQAPSVYSDLSVIENLRYFAAILDAPRSDPARVIGQVGLAGRERDQAGRLSGGQRARVSLAAALLGQPELLVLDEPTVGLDPALRQELWTVFHRLAGDGVTLLISSHVMDEASRCTRLLLMRDGQIIADDTPGALLARTGAADVEGAFLKLIKADEPGDRGEKPAEHGQGGQQ
jgi:ABC-2 type transport system ATP-binding protein